MNREVRTDELLEAIKAVFGDRTQLLRRSVCPYSSTHRVEELKIEVASGSRLNVIFKDLSPSAVLPAAHGVRPSFLCSYPREIQMYTSVLRRLDAGTPLFHGSIIEADKSRVWLFVEQVPGVGLSQVGDFNIWLEVAQWLARFHSSPACDAVQARAAVPDLRDYVREIPVWFDRAKALRCEIASVLGEHGPRVMNVLRELPTALVHGDFYASNILIGEGSAVRVCPIDWEMSGTGPALLDLAAFISGKWSPTQRAQLVGAYYSAVSTPLRPADFEMALHCCRIQVAVQWLGWSGDWNPPEAQALDWMKELRDLLAETGQAAAKC
jgi:hypothetical protein